MKAMLAAGCLLLSGCASELVISKNADAGLPIAAPTLMIVKTTTTYTTSPTVSAAETADADKICGQSLVKRDVKMLPLGEVRYVNFNPSWFGKSEFKVEYSDSGSLKSVSLNSDPAATVEASTGLLSSILPYLGKPQVEMLAGKSAEELRAKYCLVNETTVELEPAPLPLAGTPGGERP